MKKKKVKRKRKIISDKSDKYAQGIRDFRQNITNPFLKVKKQEENKPQTGFEVTLSQDISSENKIKTQQFIHNHASVTESAALNIICDVLKDKLNITSGGIVLFSKIHGNIKTKTDFDEDNMTIVVDYEKYREICEYKSVQSVYYAMSNLLAKNIIARSRMDGVYFINPNFFMASDSIIISDIYSLKSNTPAMESPTA